MKEQLKTMHSKLEGKQFCRGISRVNKSTFSGFCGVFRFVIFLKDLFSHYK